MVAPGRDPANWSSRFFVGARVSQNKRMEGANRHRPSSAPFGGRFVIPGHPWLPFFAVLKGRLRESTVSEIECRQQGGDDES